MEPTFENLDKLNADIAKLFVELDTLYRTYTTWGVMESNREDKLNASIDNLVGQRNTMEHLLAEFNPDGYYNYYLKGQH